MHNSDFIFISVIALALFQFAVSIDSNKGTFPVFIQTVQPQPVLQNATSNIQTPSTNNNDTQPLIKDGISTLKDNDFIEIKQNDTGKKTTLQENDNSPTKQTTTLVKNKPSIESVLNLPFRRRRMSDASNKPDIDALNKMKLKLKLMQTKADLKGKAEAAKKISFPKDETNKYMHFKITSKEERDNVKREQILQWLYNARPLLSNETKLWANDKSEKNKQSDKGLEKDPELKTPQKESKKLDKENKKEAEFKTQTDNKKSEEYHKKEVDFYTIETETKEKKTSATNKPVALSEKSTTAAPKAANVSEESDSSAGNGLQLESTKFKKVKSKEVKFNKAETKAKIASRKESESGMSDESVEESLEKKDASRKQNNERTLVHHFAPNDGPSSSESTNI